MTGNDLYQAAILALAEAATGEGGLPLFDGEATTDNPLCGDRATVQVRVENGAVTAVGHQVRGCLLCRAAAAAMARSALGATATDTVRAVDSVLAGKPPAAERWAPLAAFRPVAARPSRHGCVRLPFEALVAAAAAAGRDQM